MNDSESQLWRGVVNCTYTGRFIAEKIVRGNGPDDCRQQLSRWMEDHLDLGSGDWTLSTHRLVAREPVEVSRPRLWPVEPPAALPAPRSVPAALRYR